MVVRKPQTFKAAVPPTLPPLPRLRVRRPDALKESPCAAVLSLVLGCYASMGQSAAGCRRLEEQLKLCVDASRAKTAGKSTINYHLSRLYRQMIPNTKHR